MEEARKLLAVFRMDLDDNQIKYTREYFPGLLILGFNSFRRTCEIMKLEWSRVDFARNVIKLKAVDNKNGKPRNLPL